MDEFHYDFLVRLDGHRWAAIRRHLSGPELTAVAVWNEKPSAGSTAGANGLERGWQPAWTPLQEGAKVLGYASLFNRSRG